MTGLKIISVNCRGLAGFKKRKDVFSHLQKFKADVICLQDIHVKKGNEAVFRNAWGRQAIIAAYKNNARGVAILTGKNQAVDLVELESDVDGNYIICNAKVADLEFLLVTIYGPNEDTPDFYARLSAKLLKMNKDIVPIIVVGDYNLVLDWEKDTQNYVRQNNPRATREINNMMQRHELIDIYREQNPTQQRFTWRRNEINVKQARLDFFLVSSSLSSCVKDCSIIPGYRTDHSLISLEIELNSQTRGNGWYKFNVSLLKDKSYADKINLVFVEVIDRYAAPIYVSSFKHNFENFHQIHITIPDRLFWEALILQLRTETITFSIRKSKQTKEREQILWKEIELLEANERLPYDTNLQNSIQQAKEEYEDIRHAKLAGSIIRSRYRWQEQSERPTSYFCNLEKRHILSKTISSLKTSNKTLICQNEIMNAFVEHFNRLFTKGEETDPQETMYYLEQTDFSRLTRSQSILMTEPIKVEELWASLRKMKNSKTPGSDGFPAEFYKFFWSRFKFILLRLFQSSMSSGSLPLTLREGIICLVPKANKPKNTIAGYRPITLLNVAYKIVSSALANRLKKVFSTMIKPEQTAFLPGRFIGDNTRLTFDLIDELNRRKETGLLIGIDFQNAFDTMSWNFIEICLNARLFPPNITRWVKMLHHDSFARLAYNGHLSQPIHLQRSCRQGDPVSCYLFILALEHLLDKIRLNDQIRGIKLAEEVYKVSAYADDTVCLLDGDINSIRALFDDLGVYAKFSGLFPNESKCKAMWLGKYPGKEMYRTTQEENFAFEWVSSIRLLGINFTNNINEILSLNYGNILQKIQNSINLWKLRSLTPIGKVTVVKTMILPQFTHLLTSLPKPDNTTLKKIKRELFSFLWGGKTERIRREIVVRDVSDGGLRMVDIDRYIISLKSSWIRRQLQSHHPWTRLFASSVSSDPTIWERSSKSLHLYANNLSNKFWKEVLLSWAQVSERYPIFGEDYLSMGLWYSDVTVRFSNSRIEHWFRKGLVRVNDLIDSQGNIFSFESLRNRYNLAFGNRMDYFMLIRSLKPDIRHEIQKGALQTPLIHPVVQFALSEDKGTGHFYRLLINSDDQPIKLWERSWELLFSVESWADSYKSVQMCSKSTYYAALHYKILTKICKTRLLLYRFGKVESPLCERCQSQIETVEHKFYLCPALQTFWMTVQVFLRSCGLEENINLATVIIGKFSNVLTDHVIILSKSLIHNSDSPPTIERLKAKLHLDMETERYAALIAGSHEKFSKKWGTLQFK